MRLVAYEGVHGDTDVDAVRGIVAVCAAVWSKEEWRDSSLSFFELSGFSECRLTVYGPNFVTYYEYEI